MTNPPSPEQAARLERQRLAAEDGAKALQEVASRAIAIRENMARLRSLRLAKEAQKVRANDRKSSGTSQTEKATLVVAVADAPAPFLMNVLVPAQPFSLETMNVTATENLLARKAKLLRQLGNGSSDAERDEIERQIAQIDTALDLLEAFGARTDHKKR